MRSLFYLLIISAFYLCCDSLNAQQIYGTVKDVNLKPIPYSNILIKENSNPSIIVEFTNARNGLFSTLVKKNYQTILIEVVSVGYHKAQFIIKTQKKEKTYSIDFVLQENKITELKEVVLVSKIVPFSIKKDTLTYHIEKYKDPLDRKVQDVLKRLPGIAVNEKSGEIKYKGKSVETVTLDGDNLFGSNYSIGTKNINVDMLEEVQAIENYSENPLLKGIEGGEKVSLNLKLKKGKTDYSGNIDFGLGLNNNDKLLNNTNTTILGISNKYKSFGIISKNNIGINHTPYDYFSGNKSIEQTKEIYLTTHKAISETLFVNNIDDEKSNINDMFFSNYNNIFKMNNRLTIKTNMYYLKDVLDFGQFSTSQNIFENLSFTTFDNYKTDKKPLFYKGDIEVKFNTSKNSLFEFQTKFNYEKIISNSLILENNLNHFEMDLLSKNTFINHKINFTKKINSNQAIQIQLTHAYNNIPQNLILNNHFFLLAINQYSQFKKRYLDATINLLGKKNRFKYSYSFGGIYENTNYLSKNNINSDNNKNLVNYIRKSIFNSGSFNLTLNNWLISPSYSIKYQNQELIDNLILNTKSSLNLLFEPSLLLKYRINNKSFISTKINFTKQPFSEEYIFTNPVVINSRIKISNSPTLEIRKSEIYNVNYYNNNLYKQFFLNIGFNFKKNNSGYFSKFLINDNETFLNYFYLKKNNDDFNLYLTTEKLISYLSTVFRLSSNFTKSNYTNKLNSSSLRNNKSINISNKFSIKTAFFTKLNFENELTYNYSLFKSENSIYFLNKSITNTVKLKYKHSNSFFSVISSEYFIPSLNNKSNNYLFLDFSIIYRPIDKKYEFNLIGKNLINNNYFSQIQTTDFSKNTLQNNLISRYVFINFTYNF